jgi:peptide/nickel transport system permease protein
MKEMLTLPDAWPLSRTLLAGLAVLAFYLCLAVLAEHIAPRAAWQTSLYTLQPPSREFPFGTDDLGRDVFSGVIHGAQTSLLVGVSVAVLSSLLGLLVGLVAGYFGGLADEVLMRLTELFLAPPRLLLALVLAALFGASSGNLILVLSLTFWPVTARLLRAEVLSLKERGFVEAARALGAGHGWLLRRTLLPHLLPLLLVTTVLRVGSAILTEAGLEFLGLGAQSRISWGYLLHNGQNFMRDAWWLVVFPILALSLLLAALNLVGDELNRVLSPRA